MGKSHIIPRGKRVELIGSGAEGFARKSGDLLGDGRVKTLGGVEPGANGGAKATLILEISTEHPIAEKLVSLYSEDKEKTAKYAKLLYAQSCLIAGRAVDNPAEFSEMICELM